MREQREMEGTKGQRWQRRSERAAGVLVAFLLALGVRTVQAQGTGETSRTGTSAGDLPTRTFYLSNVSQLNEANDIVTALRNLLDPRDKVYLVSSENAILVQATPDQLKLAEKVLNDLDRPRRTYRLLYTITEMDGGKRVGAQHFAMVVVTGQRTMLKQGSKVPIVTGSYNPGTPTQNTQVTYLDIGINLDATLDEFNNGVRLRTKAEQSSVAEEHSGVGPQDPVVRQTVLEGTSFLTAGKALRLGSLDVPGSTRHLDLEVVMEQIVP